VEVIPRHFVFGDPAAIGMLHSANLTAPSPLSLCLTRTSQACWRVLGVVILGYVADRVLLVEGKVERRWVRHGCLRRQVDAGFQRS
jgi:hypothetical protein